MHIRIVTLFPEFFAGPLSSALMQRAQDAGIVTFSLHNPRDFSTDKHHHVDDRPYGGGPGMVMLAEPLAATLRSLGFEPRGAVQPGRLFFLTPKGVPLSQKLAKELALGSAEHKTSDFTASDSQDFSHSGDKQPRLPELLTLICGRYEGIDARIEEFFPIETISVGDFVLNGGEAGALCLIEAVSRLLPGFMGHEDSGEDESFSHGLLEYPHYTRPETFADLPVPDVLRSGDHKRIATWRRQSSLKVTLDNRPELLSQAALTDDDREFLQQCSLHRSGRNLYCALVHYPVLDKQKNSVAVSLTNLDIHDIARSSYTYGLGGYYVVTPLHDQQELLRAILSHWRNGPGKISNPHRDQALGIVSEAATVADAIADVTTKTGQEPYVVLTTARFSAGKLPGVGFTDIQQTLHERPVLLLFGTGHGLSSEIHAACHAFAPPVRWHGGYNHLSVRAAVAIILDRILGDWQ